MIFAPKHDPLKTVQFRRLVVKTDDIVSEDKLQITVVIESGVREARAGAQVRNEFIF